MKKFKLTSLLCLFALAIVSTTFTSCGDDEPETVMGCTDEDADNYNANATTDDGTCSFVGRFEGSYNGTFDCPVLVQFESAMVTISAIAGNPDQMSFIIMTGEAGTDTELIIPMSATVVDKNNISIIVNIANQDLSANSIFAVAGPDARWDIAVDGALELQANGNLEGTVMINIAENTGTGIILADNCGFVAVPI